MKVLRIIAVILAISFTLPALSSAAEKETLRGKVISIDSAKGVIVIEAPFGKEVTFSASSPSLFEKLKKGDVEIGDRITVWYTKTDGKNLIQHVRFRGCG